MQTEHVLYCSNLCNIKLQTHIYIACLSCDCQISGSDYLIIKMCSIICFAWMLREIQMSTKAEGVEIKQHTIILIHDGTLEFIHDFQLGLCYSIFNFMCLFCGSLFVFCTFCCEQMTASIFSQSYKLSLRFCFFHKVKVSNNGSQKHS